MCPQELRTSEGGVFGDRFSVLINHPLSIAVIRGDEQSVAGCLTHCLDLPYSTVWRKREILNHTQIERGREREGGREREREREGGGGEGEGEREREGGGMVKVASPVAAQAVTAAS